MKTSIYLPDDLAQQVRKYKISMSEVVQAALHQAVTDAEAVAQSQEAIKPHVEVAVARMRQVLAEEERAREAERAAGRSWGVLWARDYATPRELREFAGSSPPSTAGKWHSLFRLVNESIDISNQFAVGGQRVYLDFKKPWQSGFRQGATAVWEAVQPILDREIER